MLPRYIFRATDLIQSRLSVALQKISKKPKCVGIISDQNAYNNMFSSVWRQYSIQPTPKQMTVTFEEVKEATKNSDILIIDVREPNEIQEHGKIANSINIPLGDVTKVLSTMTDSEFKRTYHISKPQEESPLIFYCMSGKRSGMAQQNAINLGYKNVMNYLGSWTDWASKS